MKRSEVNNYLKEAESFFAENKFFLPAWASWSPAEWRNKGDECREIKECALGWDITDFGSGDFENIGLLLFTLRNGILGSGDFNKTYAEKIMLVKVNQVTPTHFHWKKTEDIINRGPGILCLQLWKADENEQLSEDTFAVSIDGVSVELQSGGKVRLKPGESITLEPYVYHNFYAEETKTLVGEVSTVNDDENDNRFFEPAGRFPAIEEDEAPLYLLCNEYSKEF